MSDNEYKTTARWQGNALMVHWYGSKTEDEAGLWLEQEKRFVYDGYEDLFEIRVPEDKKPEASLMLDIMQAHQHGY